MKFSNETALNQADADGAATQSSSAIDALSMVSASVQGVAVGGTITGALKVQFSNDAKNPTNWSDVPSATVAVSAAGVVAIPKFETAYRWIRVFYTKTTSASGATITAQVNSLHF